ncbi:NAD(P)/FAD-dependent oxidoreductase [Saccharospirillum sp.]|uniref:NAD(P)/FAD-dependent oxidoreductase n=1 Tax=Saccharospirillum sp. TaxID=2033801 RepID=UPI0034A011E4
MKPYDLIVVGSGAGGLTAAFTALGFGKRVLIVEKDRPGGECTWSGCVPSKALINQAKEVHIARKFADISVDTGAILERVRAVSEHVYEEETPEVLQKAGADYVNGFARFISPTRIEVGEKTYEGKKFVLATGSSPFVPPIPGLDQVDYLTNENLFQQETLPASVIVLGGGPIGMELAQAMNRLGVQVTLVEMMPEILSREEPEFSALIRQCLSAEGVRFELGTKAVGVEKMATGVRLNTEKDSEAGSLEAGNVLVAIGRAPNVKDMGLEDIGVDVDKGVRVNQHLQTSVKSIYACGDVAGPYLLSHMANFQGKIAAMNAILPINRSVDYSHVAWATFTDPEFARAGMTEHEARELYGDGIRVYRYDFAKLDRAKTKAGDIGLIKLITSSRGKVLGAHIIGERAGEMIAEVQVMKTLNLNFGKLQKVIHPYPTYADSLRQLSQQVLLDNIFKHPVVSFLRSLGQSKKQTSE